MQKKRYLLMLECELHQWAKEFGGHQDRSISYIVNRALRNAKDAVDKKSLPAVPQKPAAKKKLFSPPTSEMVLQYMDEKMIGDRHEAEKFVDFYESKGWVVGKAKMKDWKAAVRNWMKGKSTQKVTVIDSNDNWHEDLGL